MHLLERPNLGALLAGVFGHLPQRLQTRVVAMSSIQHVPARGCVRRQGDGVHSWIGVVAGALRLSMPMLDGRTTALEWLGPGSFFGDVGRASVHDVEAVTSATLLALRAEDFRKLMQTEPDFAFFVTHHLSLRLQAAQRAAGRMACASLEDKVLELLQDLAKQFGVRERDEWRIELPIVQQDLADLVGASRQRVNMALRDLAERGRVRLDGRRIHLPQERPALARAA